jgi:hypothetical protein
MLTTKKIWMLEREDTEKTGRKLLLPDRSGPW